MTNTKKSLKKLYALMGELQETKKAHIERCEIRQDSSDRASWWLAKARKCWLGGSAIKAYIQFANHTKCVDSDTVKIKELGVKLAKLEVAIAALVG